MFSLETIRKMEREATERARQEELTPYIATKNGDEGVRACYTLGEFVPEGWKKVNSYFVDNSGFGTEGEGALTFEQLLKKVRKGYGYGIGQTGQFQIYIHEYKRIK